MNFEDPQNDTGGIVAGLLGLIGIIAIVAFLAWLSHIPAP